MVFGFEAYIFLMIALFIISLFAQAFKNVTLAKAAAVGMGTVFIVAGILILWFSMGSGIAAMLLLANLLFLYVLYKVIAGVEWDSYVARLESRL
jgi:hypothetical protein